MKVDSENKEFNLAFDFIKNTNRNVYLTGKAGAGKTTFLKHIKEEIKKNIVVVAPTGIAAINAGGVTIHSLFQIKPGVYYPNDKRLRRKAIKDDDDKRTIYDHFKLSDEKKKILQSLQLLVIDEISMVRCDLLDVVDKLLRVYGGGNPMLPFGGKQVLLIGDAFQLPPVTSKEEWNILKRFYKNPFFFGSKAFQEASPICIELQKIYRQNDPEFISLLNRIRVNEATDEDILTLNKKVPNCDFNFSEQDYIFLGTHNKSVAATNREKLGQLQKPLHQFEAEVRGKFPEKDMPTLKILSLKEGAQIMFVKNDPEREKRFYNGKIAKIKSIEDDEIEVRLDTGESFYIEKLKWEKIKYRWNDKKKEIEEVVEGSFTQYPIKLAWAITVHKSQGLTFERVYADITDAFAAGQVYVALSRCTSMEGLKLVQPIHRYCIMTDEEVLKFANQYTNANPDEEG